MRIGDMQGQAEVLARSIVEHVLGVSLVKVDPGSGADGPTPDFRCVSPSMAVEVKVVTSSDYLGLSAVYRAAPVNTPIPGLVKLWSLLITAGNASEVLRGDFGRGTQPNIKALGRTLKPHLLVLEQHGIDNYLFGLGSADSEVAEASAAIRRLIRGGQCGSIEPVDGFVPGLLVLGLGMAYSRSPDPNVLVDFLEDWMKCRGENLCASLCFEEGSHHGVIVLDADTVAEVREMDEQGAAYLPTRVMKLPAEIDFLWVVAGTAVLLFNHTEGSWSRPAVAL